MEVHAPCCYLLFFCFVRWSEGNGVVGLINVGRKFGSITSLVWDDATTGLFAAIMSFWFGNRAVVNMLKVKP